MIKMNKFLILALLLLVAACAPKKPSGETKTLTENGQSILYVDMDQSRDTIDFDISALVDSCRVIRLENRPEALIGRVSGMAFTDNRIYLYHQMKYLMSFDYQGKYREQIGNLGKGPYEYVYLNNLALSENGSWILGQPHHIDQYIIFNSKGEGKMLVPRKLGGIPEVMILNDNQVVEFGYKGIDVENTDDKNISLYIQDFSGNILLERSPLYLASFYRIGGNFLPISFYRFKDQFHVHFSRDTLFNLNINTGSLVPLAVFTASQNGYDYPRIEKELDAGLSTSLDYTGKVYAEIHAETPRYYLIRQMKQQLGANGDQTPQAVNYFSVDKKKKTTHPVRLKDSFYGMDLEGEGNPIPFQHWSIIDNKYGVLNFQAIELKEEIARRLKDPQLSAELKNKLKALDSSISQEDNLVLFVYYLKKS
ncbi:MAG: 6-bladed beta-propeller [Porphyromonadaceae bacterium]|nr:MAG: 6-bladed beta-propeller [Porphyromonadaceae bacterium]